MTKFAAVIVSEEQNYGGRVKQQRTKFRAKHETKVDARKNTKKPKDRSSLRNMFT